METGNADQVPGPLTDRFGAIASGLCAIHCALCALAPAAFVALGLGALLTHEAELLLTLVAIVFGLTALVLGWRRHREASVLWVMVAGILALVASRGLEMGSDHHGHHEGEHSAHHEEGHEGEGEHGEKDSAEHSEEAEKAADGHGEKTAEKGHAKGDAHEEEHEGGLHAVGAAAGVLGGLLLLSGHIMNLKALRRERDECCDDESESAA